jgi:hypothetical protein
MKATLRLSVLIATAAIAAVVATSGIAAGPVTISTLSSFGGFGISPFGKPTYASGGQTLVVPNNVSVLTNFALELNLPTTVTFRAEVYAWDGSEATGPALWESAPTVTPTSFVYNLISFSPNVAVTPGQQLVLFVTVSRDYVANPSITGLLGITANPYAAGSVVELDDQGDPSLWTTTAWSPSPVYDLAFTATFSSVVTPSPRGGYCAVAGNTWPDGTAIAPGTFLNLELGQASSDPNYKGAPPSAYFQGIGITCDNPPPGFHDTGTMVSEDGTPFGDAIYEYWTKS